MARTIRGLIVGLGMALLVLAPVAAGTSSESRYFERGHYAFASESVCTSAPGSHRTTCRDFSIDVFKGRRGGTDPACRFTGYEVRVNTSRETFDHATGRIIRQGFELGVARNSAALRVRLDRLGGASVEGIIRVSVTSCDRSGQCENNRRQMVLALDWKARPGPASESFTYYRLNDAGCEFTYTDTRRGRRARTVGDVDGRAMRMRGALLKVDLQTTEVCQ